jgi:hypothetical protein
MVEACVMRRSAWVGSIVSLLVTLGCASEPRDMARLRVALTLPKALEADEVKLYVYDQAKLGCADRAIAVPPTSVERVFEIAMARCPSDPAAWCANATLPRDPSRPLTFYVEGRRFTDERGFTGCDERAVDQDPLQLELRAKAREPGAVCGDLRVALGETCDPGKQVSDEACDGATCQTKEVVVSNGLSSDGFFRGLPGRKAQVSIAWGEGGFFAAWSDKAVGSGGGDGNAEITVRKLAPSLVTERTPVVLAREVRLPNGPSPTTSGTKQRNGAAFWPTFLPLSGGNGLVVFEGEGKVRLSVQGPRFGATAADATIAGAGLQSAPHAAVAGTGDALVAYVEANSVRSVLRKPDGTLGAPQTLSSGGAVTRPRVVWIGAGYVVVWSDGEDVKLRRVGADGTPLGPEAIANQARLAGRQDQPDVAGFETGEFLVAFRDAAGDEGADIRIQRFDKDGAATGTEIAQVLNDVRKAGDQGDPAVAAGRAADGTRFYVVAWSDASGGQISARYVRTDGAGYFVNQLTSSNSEFAVGVGSRARSWPAAAVSSAQGAIAIGWIDDEGGDPGADDDRVRVRRLPLPDVR